MNLFTRAFLYTVTVCLSAFHSTAQEESVQPTVAWEITEGLKAPESVYFDSDSKFLFLSQIGEGGGMKADGDGWISKLTPDGRMVKNKWITGLDAPKGLRSHDGILWVSDITVLVAIDIGKGEIVKKIPVPDAQLLNDVACGPDGAVYVTDMFANKVWRYFEDKLSEFASGDDLEHPNGILVHDGKVLLATWGKQIQDDFSTKVAGRILAINIETGKRTAITPEPTGNLDGIESDGAGSFSVTDWFAGKVYKISANGGAELLLSRTKGLADHAYLPERKLLILPEMLENRLVAFKIQ